MTLRGEDPNKYVNDPNLYKKLVVQFAANDLTPSDVNSVLQKQGFNLPPNLVETPAPTVVEETVASGPAPHDLIKLLPDGTSPDLISTATAGLEPIRETETMLTLPSPGGGEVMMSPALKEDPTALALAARPTGDLPSGPAQTLIETPISDLREGADLSFSEAQTVQGEVPVPVEPEGRVVEDAVVDVIPATVTDTGEAVGLRLTPKDVETLSPQVQAVVDAFMEESGSEFFNDTAELPFKADIDAVDLQIKGLNDRLEQIGEEKIKPYFGKDDTGRKILAAIAAGVGAYASAMSGTPNYALGIINKAIDDDLDKQKQEIGFRRKSLEDQRILLTTKRMELLKMTEMQLNKAWRQAQDTRAQQKLKALLTEVFMRKDTEEKKLVQAQVEKLLKQTLDMREGLVPNMGVSGGEDGVSRLTGHARKMAIESAMEFNVIYGEAQRTVAELLDLTQKDKIDAMSTEALSETRTKFVTGITALKLLAAKKIYKFGAALTTNEEKMLNEIIADAGRANIALNVTSARLHNFMAILERKRESIRDGGGFQPIGKKGGAQESTGKGGLPAFPGLEIGTTGAYKP